MAVSFTHCPIHGRELITRMISSTRNLKLPISAVRQLSNDCSKTECSDIKSMIRVNLAGETGADKIYEGQLSILGNSTYGPKIREMWEQEKQHKAKFEELINKYRARPSFLSPLWNVAGFALGAGTALMGPKAAMACTVAVESVIVEHYNDQLRELMTKPNMDEELLNTIKKFRDDEQEHHDTGIEYKAEEAFLYEYLSKIIKTGSKCAIVIAKVL